MANEFTLEVTKRDSVSKNEIKQASIERYRKRMLS
mgnify:CR=1 FL=1